MPLNARVKGNTFEVVFCRMLRLFGYQAVTSRSESKAMDDKGVDTIDSTPFYFQLKAVERLNTSYHDILKGMPTEKVRIVIHKRNNKGTVAVMYLEDFQDLLLKKDSQFYEGL